MGALQNYMGVASVIQQWYICPIILHEQQSNMLTHCMRSICWPFPCHYLYLHRGSQAAKARSSQAAARAAASLQLLERIPLALEEQEREEEVRDEDEDQRDDHCRGGAVPHALCAAAGRVSPGAAHLRACT